MSRTSQKAGLPPGTLLHIGQDHGAGTSISLLAYGPDEHRQVEVKSWTAVEQDWGKEPVRWVNINGVQDPGLVQEAGARFGLHVLQLEDVMNTGHRPTFMELDGGGWAMICKMIELKPKRRRLSVEQITVVVQRDGVLSFQEREGDLFDGLRERLAAGGGTTRGRGAEYLGYRLVDTVVDQYFHVTDHLMDEAEALELRIMSNADAAAMRDLQGLKKMLPPLRRAVAPMREAVGQLLKEPPAVVEEETMRHWHDVHDHLLQLHDHLEALRETFGGLMDLHANGVNQRTNQVMQLMTMVATIFIPLTFIAGVYGMNFESMPELQWRYGYAAVWVLMLAVAGGMFLHFRKRGWI